MTDKLPAGNTGRHEDSIFWDRLRADLANLGASYGEMPRFDVEIDVKPAEPVSYPSGNCSSLCTATSHACAQPGHWAMQTIYPSDYTIASKADRNLYYDEIILAARKRREFMNALGPSKACVLMQATDVGGLGHHFTAADENSLAVWRSLSRPLSFEPRVGWMPEDDD